MSSVQSELRYALYESQAEWNDSGGTDIFSSMLESVPNPPVLSRTPPNFQALYTRYTNQIHRISPNRFGNGYS